MPCSLWRRLCSAQLNASSPECHRAPRPQRLRPLACKFIRDPPAGDICRFVCSTRFSLKYSDEVLATSCHFSLVPVFRAYCFDASACERTCVTQLSPAAPGALTACCRALLRATALVPCSLWRILCCAQLNSSSPDFHRAPRPRRLRPLARKFMHDSTVEIHADPQPHTLGLARSLQAAVAVSGALRSSSSVSSGNQRWQHLQPQSQPLAREHQFQQYLHLVPASFAFALSSLTRQCGQFHL